MLRLFESYDTHSALVDDHAETLLFRNYRSTRPLTLPDLFVAIYPYDQKIAKSPGCFKIHGVTLM